MSNIHEMLGMNNGSFQKAEQMALDLISKGQTQIWLDLALLMHAQGNIEGSKQAQNEYAKHHPDCDRLRFGQTWMKLYDGDLQGGLQHIEAGRACGTLGCPDFSKLNKPAWDGKKDLKNKTVLLYGEGGQGDQIMGLRSAYRLEQLGAKVVVACSKSLVSLFSKAKSVSSVVAFEQCHGVHYDYWVPMMSSFGLCQATWETLWHGQYLTAPENQDIWKRIIPREKNILNVGIRWRGNPEFEHEQLRWFPPQLMFQATNIEGVKLYSLQKEDTSVELPENICDLAPLLGDWEQTAMAMQQLDLVITSCTSIAHLAASMNLPTWVIVPAMPYYPWARPGRKSDWYPSVTLFRQKCYGDWVSPFIELQECLKRKVKPTCVIERGFDEFKEEHGETRFENVRFMEADELSVIAGLVKKHNIKSVLEIGINKGETAKAILTACPDIERYAGIEITKDAIDTMNPHQRNEREWVGDKIAAEVKNDRRVTVHVSKLGSKDFSTDKPFDLVFIDGNHAYEWVKHDIALAEKLNAKVVVWHDYGSEEGVTRAVDEVFSPVVRVLRTRMAYMIINES